MTNTITHAELGLCGECRHFRPHRNYRSQIVDASVVRGECKRLPPRPPLMNPAPSIDADIAIGLADEKRDYRIAAFWPIVDEVDGCGEFGKR